MYKSFNNLIIRIPTYPFSTLAEGVLAKIHDRLFQQAIYIASPTLFTELRKAVEERCNFTVNSSIGHSLNRYFTRMSTRCTPFGLFAGCATAKIADATSLLVDGEISMTNRLDMSFLCLLSQLVQKKIDIVNSSFYYPNSTIFRIGKKFYYIEFEYINLKKKHKVTTINYSSCLAYLLIKIRDGARIGDMIQLLLEKGISKEEATSYIYALIDAQFIVGELNPSVTGSDYFEFLSNKLFNISTNDNIIRIIKEIKDIICELNLQTSNPIKLYSELALLANETNIPYSIDNLLQVDITRKMSNSTISRKVIEELENTIDFLDKITTNRSKNTNLYDFQNTFYNRYGDQEVLLLEALDPEIGLGYPIHSKVEVQSPLLDKLNFPNKVIRQSTRPQSLFHSILKKKLISSIQFNEKEIVLTDKDVQTLKGKSEDLPPTIYALFELIRSDENGLLINLKSLSGSCAANMLARFAHTNKDIYDFVHQIVQKEQELMPNAIIAEIVHLPDCRIGNVLTRPHLRDYEIIYLANSDLSNEKRIYASDLLLSVKQGRLYLRSKNINKEIIPRLTTAHNYHHHTLPVYRFLCDLQLQNTKGNMSFQWEGIDDDFNYLPRIKYKNTILSLATWKVEIASIKHLFSLNNSQELISEVRKWRHNISINQHTLLIDGDNTLYVDWENAISIQSMFAIIKNRRNVKFSEFVFDSQKAVVHDKEGRSYLNECIAAFYKK